MKTMNIKRIFGTLLTVLGIASLIYAAILFANISDNSTSINGAVVYCILGLVFFIPGIGLIRTTRDNT